MKEKLSKRQLQLLELLEKSSDFCTAQSLAAHLNISVRTVKSEISALVRLSGNGGFCIQSKPRHGYRLSRREDHETAAAMSLSGVAALPQNAQERVEYIIRKLLVVDYHVRSEELADELGISEKGMTLVLRGVRDGLEKYHLKLVSRTGYGVLIEGEEADKRLAISEYFFNAPKDRQSAAVFAENSIENTELMKRLAVIFRQYRIEMAEASLRNLCIHIAILVRRARFYNYIHCSDEALKEINGTIEYKAAGRIVEYLEKEHHYMLPIGENVYLAQHILCKRITDIPKMSVDQNRLLNNCITVILAEISNNFGIDLIGNAELMNYLRLHIPPMIMRLKYHMSIRNPLVFDNKRRYLFATKVTHSACAVISNYYHVAVDDNEFGYLMLYFNLAISQEEAGKHIQIGVATDKSRPETKMYLAELQNHFAPPKYLLQSVPDLKKCPPLDLLISPGEVRRSPACPVYVIHNDNYVEEIGEYLSHLRYQVDLCKYMKPEYCCFDLGGSTKEEVLDSYYRMLMRRGVIRAYPAGYERFEYDELGNSILHLQDTPRIVHSDLCFFAVLKKPVYWDREMIRVLILTKTKKDNDQDLYNLCRILSRWANSRKMVDSFIRNRDFGLLLEDMKGVLK